MPRPTTKADLLALSEANYTTLIKKVSSLPEEEILKLREGRSIKDHLAHLHEWHNMFLTWYKVGMTGDKAPMPAPGFTWKETPALNAEIDATYKDMPLQEVYDLLHKTHQQLQKLIASHSQEELFTKKLYGWTGSTSLGSYAISATSSHYDWALKKLKSYKV